MRCTKRCGTGSSAGESTIAATVGETTGVGTGDARETVVVGSGAVPEWDRLLRAGVVPNVERATTETNDAAGSITPRPVQKPVVKVRYIEPPTI